MDSLLRWPHEQVRAEHAFGHHVWATLQVIDACVDLGPEQLETAVPGTYGSILDTVRHLVGSDSRYLFDITGDRARRIDEGRMDLPALRTAMEGDGTAWSELLAKEFDPDAVLKEIDEEDVMVENAPSNAICRKLGFTLLGEIDFPARQGGFVRCNDWRFDLFAKSDVPA